jgi:tRNA-specific 2-thiouridylase
MRFKADWIATGHYADKIITEDNVYIKKGKDSKKDQSYYLCLVKRDIIKKTLFPLNSLNKATVRKIAGELGLEVSNKKDSQEICFLEGVDYKEYLKDKIDACKIRKGDFILDGKVVGHHDGIEFYTIGQSKGLGLGHHEKLYVKSIDPVSHHIVLTKSKNEGSRGVALIDCNFFNEEKKFLKASAKLRYRMKEADCLVELLPDNRAHLLFDEPQAFPAPGQVAAIYRDDLLIGGGYIEKVF